jgi:hypothetical protein
LAFVATSFAAGLALLPAPPAAPAVATVPPSSLESLGGPVAFSLALTAALAAQATALMLRSRRLRPQPAAG